MYDYKERDYSLTFPPSAADIHDDEEQYQQYTNNCS